MTIKRGLLGIFLAICLVVGYKCGIDFPAYYKVSSWLTKGLWEQIYAPDGTMRWFYYPPVALLFFYPFGLFSMATAKILWLILQSLSFVVFWVCLHRLFPILRKSWAAWLLVFILALNPIHTGFQCQNMQVMLAATLILSHYLSTKSSPGLLLTGGILCALASSMKLYPLFLSLYYLLTAKKQFIWGLGLGFLFAALSPFVFFGLADSLMFYQGFYNNLFVYHSVYTLNLQPENLSLMSGLSVWLPKLGGGGVMERLPQMLCVAVGLLFFALVLKNKKARNTPPEEWTLAWAMMALLNSTSRPDHTIFLVPAGAALTVLLPRLGGWRLTALSFIGLALLAFTTEFVLQSRSLNNQLELWRVPVVGMLCLIIALVAATQKSKQSPLVPS